jgi:hypothetical protein
MRRLRFPFPIGAFRRVKSEEHPMQERDVRKMLRQDIHGKYVMRPLHEFVVTNLKKKADEDLWSFSWDSATLQHPPGDFPPPVAAIAPKK